MPITPFEALNQRLQAFRRYRRILSDLRQMDRQELDDLGISPGSLQDVARKYCQR